MEEYKRENPDAEIERIKVDIPKAPARRAPDPRFGMFLLPPIPANHHPYNGGYHVHAAPGVNIDAQYFMPPQAAPPPAPPPARRGRRWH
jgi:hypothetical protein